MNFIITDSNGDTHQYVVPGVQGVSDAAYEAVRGVITAQGLWLNPAHIVTIKRASVQDG